MCPNVWSDLRDVILNEISQYTTPTDMIHFAHCSKTLFSICSDDSLWRRYFLINYSTKGFTQEFEIKNKKINLMTLYVMILNLLKSSDQLTVHQQQEYGLKPVDRVGIHSNIGFEVNMRFCTQLVFSMYDYIDYDQAIEDSYRLMLDNHMVEILALMLSELISLTTMQLKGLDALIYVVKLRDESAHAKAYEKL